MGQTTSHSRSPDNSCQNECGIRGTQTGRAACNDMLPFGIMKRSRMPIPTVNETAGLFPSAFSAAVCVCSGDEIENIAGVGV